MTYLGAPSMPDDATLAIEPFLDHELARVRGLAENKPDEAGKYTELFWSLVVGLSKTKDLSLVQSIELANDYLLLKAPELSIPAKIDAGTERMQHVQKKIASYQVDPAFQYNLALVSSADLWKARGGMAVMAIICIGALLFNHYCALNDGKIYPAIIYVLPIPACLSLAGIVDPRIFWAVTKHGQNMPARFKWIGGLVALFGAGLIFFLAFYYHLGR